MCVLVTVSVWQQNLTEVLEKEEHVGSVGGKEDTVQFPTISSSTSTMLKNLFMVLDFLYMENSRSGTKLKFCKFFVNLVSQICSGVICVFRFADDYRIALQRTYTWTNQVSPDVTDAQGFFVCPRPRHRQNVRLKKEVLTLSFWCLNPAVVRGKTCQTDNLQINGGLPGSKMMSRFSCSQVYCVCWLKIEISWILAYLSSEVLLIYIFSFSGFL